MLPGRQITVETALNTLRRYRWLVIVPVFAGALGGLLTSRLLPSRYRSDALIQIVPQRVPESYVSATVTDRVEDRLRAISQEVLSRTQLEKLVVDLDLFPVERAEKPMEDVIALVQERVTIAPVAMATGSARSSGADAFRVSFDYEDADKAQKVVERLARFYIDTNTRERRAQAEQTSGFLESQLAEARARLEAHEEKLKNFRERNAGRLPTQMQSNMQAIQNAQMALQATVESLARDRDRKLILERLYKEERTEEESTSAMASDATLDRADVTQGDAPPAQRLGAARRALAQMQLRLSARHPDVIRLEGIIADLERQVEDESRVQPVTAAATATTTERPDRRDRLHEQQAELESLDRQIAFKVDTEQRLRAQVAAYQARLEAVPGIESEWVALTRDYDTLATTYRDLLAKSENSKLAASLEQRQIGEQFRILDPPRVALRPHSPNRRAISAGGLVAGLGLGLLLVGVMYIRDSTMRSEPDVLDALDLPLLALVPYVRTDADVRAVRRRRVLEWVALAAMLTTTGVLVWALQLWRVVL